MKKTIWALMDDRTGSVGQARGILPAIADEFEVIEKKIVYNRLAALPNCIRRKTLIGIDRKQSAPIKGEPFPDAVLSISRRTAPIALWLKKASKGKTKIIQLMFPGKFGASEMDLIVIPEHDRGKAEGENLLYITGCAHRISPQALEEARQKWTPAFASLPKPLTAILVGGAIKNKPFTDKNAEMLADAILKVHNQVSGSILITSSRRTGKSAEDIIMKKLAHIPAYTYLWGEKKENPIMGFYACADRIIVTGDSVSMACESCGSGKPVMVFSGKNWLTPKHQRFVQSLFDGGYAVDINAYNVENTAAMERLDPAAEIAERIKALFK